MLQSEHILYIEKFRHANIANVSNNPIDKTGEHRIYGYYENRLGLTL